MRNPLTELTLDELRQRTSVKWRYHPPDVLPLWVAEMDVPVAPPIAAAVDHAMAIGDTGYPAGGDYAEALLDFAKQRWGWTFELEHTALVPDVMLGIVEVLRLITGPGDAVVINSPVYPPFYNFIEHADRRVVEAPLNDARRLELDVLDAAFRRATEGDRRAVFLLCSPHNPTGTVHSADELTAVADLAERRGVRVVVDEIHAPMVYPDARQVPFLSVPGGADAFAVLSASKAFNLAGLKAAVVVAGPAAAAELARMPEEVGHGASHLGVIAHSAGLTSARDWLDDLIRGLDDNRRLLGELLADHLPSIAWHPPDGTYLAWLDCRSLGLPGDPAEVFLERGRVGLLSGSTFGTGGDGFVRLNFATSPANLTEAVRRMASSV